MTHTEHVHIDLGERSYDIAIGAGLLDNATAWQGLPKAGAALIVTNDTVAPVVYTAKLRWENARPMPPSSRAFNAIAARPHPTGAA